MTKFIAVAIRDSALDAYGRPFFVPSVGVAQRSFADEVNREDAANPMFVHTKDFDLWALGEWNDETGEFVNASPPRMIVRGSDVKLPKEV